MQRRVPSQERSRKRYEAILDAAATLFADQGFEGTTMDAVAQQADTSIGSVYQFFPNKKAIYLAMAERLMVREEQVLEEVVAANAGKPWNTLLDAVIEAFVQLQESEPAWRALWATNLSLFGDVAEMGETYHRRIVQRTEVLVSHYAPKLSPKRRKLVASTIVEAIASMLMVSYRYPPKIRRAMLGESKRMVQLYAADVLDVD